MVQVIKVKTDVAADVAHFIDLPYQLYADSPYWVPPLRDDMALILDRAAHPLYKTDEADFFIVMENGRILGRAMVLAPRTVASGQQLQQQQRKESRFALFDCVDSPEAAEALFTQLFAWAEEHNCGRVYGPSRLGFLDGDGVLVEGFDRPQLLNMSPYNFSYYQALLTDGGLSKELDFYNYHIDVPTYQFPPWFERVLTFAKRNDKLKISRSPSLEGLLAELPQIVAVLQRSLGSSGNVSLETAADEALALTLQQILRVGLDPQLIPTIRFEDEIVGSLFAFPNVSDVLRQQQGVYDPAVFGTAWQQVSGIVMNGFGILPDYHYLGGNALLFAALKELMDEMPHIEEIDLVQIPETAVGHRRDIETLGILPSQTFRRYQKIV